METNSNIEQSQFLELGNLRKNTANYPEELRNDVEWLGGYLREQCNSNLAALAAKVADLGYATHDTTLSRVLRGKLFDEEQKPIMRLKVLSNLIAALRKLAMLASMTGRVPFVETTTWDMINDYIDYKRAPETVCKFGLIVGATGSQKSECCKQYQIRNRIGTVVHLESPETPNMAKFITSLAHAYGVSEWQKTNDKLIRIAECVTATSVIIIDNIQRMYRDQKGWDQVIFNFLQKLQDDTRCTVILVAVPDFATTLTRGMDKGFFEQFEGRVGGVSEFLVLPEYAPQEDVLAVAKAFKLADADKHVGELEKIVRQRGRIRILFNALQKAVRVANSQRKPVEMRHVRIALNQAED